MIRSVMICNLRKNIKCLNLYQSSLITSKLSYYYLPQKYGQLKNTYWQNLLPQIQNQAQNIIKLIIKNPRKTHEVSQLLESYLKFDLSIFSQNRTQKGVVAVLVAINQSKIASLQYFTHRIIQFLCHSQDEFCYDTQMINTFISYLGNRSKQALSKNKKSQYKINFINVIRQNLDKISHHNIYHVLKLLQVLSENKSTIQRARFLSLADEIQQKINSLMLLNMSKNLSNSYKNLQFLSQQQFITIYFKHIGKYGFKNNTIAEICWKFIQSNEIINVKLLCQTNSFKKIINYYYQLNDCYINLIPIRIMILNKIQSAYQTQKQIKHNFQSFPSYFIHNFLMKTFTTIFHQYFIHLEFSYFQNFKFLKSNTINQIPKIPSFIWQVYDFHKPNLKKQFLGIIISKIFSRQSCQITAQNNSNSSSERWIDNESTLKVILALQNLNLQFKRQIAVMSHKVDFLIDNNIVLEFDGDLHLDFRTYELNQNTAFRNSYLILGGYKLITLNIYQFNANRSLEQLTSLIRMKIQLIQQKDVIFVQ